MDPCMDPSTDPSKKPSKFVKTDQKFKKSLKLVKSRQNSKKSSKLMFFDDTFVNFGKKYAFCCIHSKIMLLGPQKSTPPIEDQKLDGRFVERIRGLSRESLIGVVQNAGARAESAPGGPRKPPGPLQRPRCLGNI